MNQAEYKALCDASLPFMAVVLYVRAFRRCMDYQTGLVSMSLRSLAMELEYHPVARSTDRPSRPTKAQVRHLVKRLIEVGLITVERKGDIEEARAAVFRCLLARTDSVRPNEEQHMSAQGSAAQQARPQPNSGKVVQFKSSTSKTPHEQHVSDISDKDDDDNACAREDLLFDDQFAAMAAQVGLVRPRQELEALFTQFRVSDEGPVPIYRVKGQWLGKWRKYCAAVKTNQVRQGNYGGGYANGKKVNATSCGLDASIEAARRNAENGDDLGILDEIAECFGGNG